LTASASATIAEVLSGITTENTPPKNAHACSKPAISSSVVSPWVGQTNRCRENTATSTSARTSRRRPACGSGISPSLPKSACSSRPGSPSATGTVLGGRR